MIEIVAASEKDIPLIEDILLDTTNPTHWTEPVDKLLWREDQVTWERLSKEYAASDFLIAFLDGAPAACMAVTDCDPTVWPEIAKGQSLFIHKLGVKRFAAGKGLADALIVRAQSMCAERGIPALRLDCDLPLAKLRAVYERNGFICVTEACLNGYDAALYEWKINSY